jgi:hypothetical protein
MVVPVDTEFSLEYLQGVEVGTAAEVLLKFQRYMIAPPSAS